MKKFLQRIVQRTCGRDNSLAGDRFVVTDAALLKGSLVQGLSAIGNEQDAMFAAMTLDRLRSDGCDLQAATLKQALASLPYAQVYDTTDRMRWRTCAAIINGSKAANDETVYAWRVAA